MPMDAGVSALVVSEYQRLVQALKDLSDGGEQKALAAAARGNSRTGGGARIAVPGMSEIVSIRPAVQVSRGERLAHSQAIRRGEPSPLSADKIAAIEAGAATADRIANSPQPHAIQAAGQALTAIDNVQDMLTTLAVVGRLVLAPMGALGRIASPILGGIIIAGDLLRVIGRLGTLAVPGYALLCSGPSAALAAGVPALIFGKVGKGAVTLGGSLNPFSRGLAVLKKRSGRSLRPSFTEMIEVAQTSQALFGVGLAFGAIVAAIGDAAFATTGAGKGAGGGLRTPRYVAEYSAMFADIAEPRGRTELRLMRAACGALMWAPLAMQADAPLTDAERVEALVAAWVAPEILAPLFKHPRLDAALELLETERLTPPAWSRLQTADAMREAGAEIPDGRGWMLPGAPAAVDGLELFATLRDRSSDGLREWIFPIRDEPLGLFAGALAARLTERLAVHLFRSADAVRYELTPPWALLESFMLACRLPNLGEDREALEAFLAAACGRIEQTGRKLLGAAELDELAAAAGVSLIKLLPPDARPPALAQWQPFRNARPGELPG